MRWYSERSKNKMKTNIVGDTRTRTMDLEDGSQVRIYTKTSPLAITRKREMEF